VTGLRPAPAGDVDYEAGGVGYAEHRRPDPRIAARVHAALGAARTVVNVGAGAGSYEPRDRYVVPVEPSAAMRAQRPRGLAPAIDATAERLPFDDGAFDAAMASVTPSAGARQRIFIDGLRVQDRKCLSRGTTFLVPLTRMPERSVGRRENIC